MALPDRLEEITHPGNMKDTALSSRMNDMLPGRVTETAHAGYRTVKAFPQRIRDIALLGRMPKNDTLR